MFRLVSRVLTLSALPIAISMGLQAQTTEFSDHDHDHADGIVCGAHVFNDGKEWEALERTARINPEAYRQIVEQGKHMRDRRSVLGAASMAELPFFVRNQETGGFDVVPATLLFEGRWARIWVDNKDTGRAEVKNKIADLARGLDSATGAKSRNPNMGIVENNQEVFGLPPVNQFDPGSPVQDFLLTDIKDGLSTGFVGGFFSSWDQTTFDGSNNMNLLYIDSKEGIAAGVTALLSTIAHEFQHLIHYRTNPRSQVLFNEGCSEVASIMLGYKDRSNSSYLRGTNVPMFTWNYSDSRKLLVDYERAMTFMYYLYEQYGEPFLTQFAKTPSEDMQRITDALTGIGREPDWMGTMVSYVVANYIAKDFSDSRYIYQTRLSTTTPVATYSYSGSGSIPTTGSVDVQSYGSVYTVYNNPGLLKVKFKASRPYQVMAILYSGGTVPVEVRELDNNQEYAIAQDGSTPYTKVVFAIASLSSAAQNVSWTVEQVAAGVEDATAETSGFGVSTIAPNPASGLARLSFNTVTTGSVSLALYNPKGELVQTLVDQQRYEAGQHELTVNTADLPNGVYMVRMLQNGHAASRVLVVLNK